MFHSTFLKASSECFFHLNQLQIKYFTALILKVTLLSMIMAFIQEQSNFKISRQSAKGMNNSKAEGIQHPALFKGIRTPAKSHQNVEETHNRKVRRSQKEEAGFVTLRCLKIVKCHRREKAERNDKFAYIQTVQIGKLCVSSIPTSNSVGTKCL